MTFKRKGSITKTVKGKARRKPGHTKILDDLMQDVVHRMRELNITEHTTYLFGESYSTEATITILGETP